MPRGVLTTPKNHQRSGVDLSRHLRIALWFWRRHQRAAWLQKGAPRPEWIFASAAGTPFDESNVTVGSLLVDAGEPVTYVSRQLGHKDWAITLRAYARWMPDDSRRKGVDRLDEAQPDGTPRNLRGKSRSAKTAYVFWRVW